MKFSLKIFAVTALAYGFINGFASNAAAHGLVQDPPSRNWFCGFITKPHETQFGQNPLYPQCAGAFANDFNGGYSFMSVLTHARGRAAATTLPENVCGFNSETWMGKATPWDTPIDWPTSPIKSGQKTFTWNISWGPHFDDTEEFRYWITKPDFKFVVGKPLAWTDFEDQAFCTHKYDDKNPAANPGVTTDKAKTLFYTQCTVPARQGRQVIYAEWGRNQYTLERFHGCLDVVFDGTSTGGDVKSVIATQPAITTEFVGAGTVLLDGRGSTGATNLTYRWTVTSPNASQYVLDTPTAATTNLRLLNPASSQAVQVALQVLTSSATNTSVLSFTHKPAMISTTNYNDLGALSPQAQLLKVGDTVQVRAVTRAGQDVFLPSAPLVITSTTAAADAWPLALAQAVNSLNTDVRVGVLGVNNQVIPVQNATSNRVYANSTSNFGSAFLIVKSIPVGGDVLAEFTINNQWNSGYCATVKVTNNTTKTVQWTTQLTVTGTVNNMWNAKWSQAGTTLTFSGPDYQPTLAAGASFTGAGFCANR